jgi:AcrR family transcriptional regulator
LTVTVVSCNVRYMSQRRDELTARSLDYLLRHGVAGLSLRPLAAEIGTSARLLVYHFGSKEGLVTAAMDELRRRVQESFGQMMARPGKTRKKDVMRTFWDWTLHPKNVPHMRLLFEVQVLAVQSPDKYARYLEGTSSSWLDLIETSLPPSTEKRIVATLCAAVIDGLLLEYLSTGDKVRTTKALEVFDRILDLKLRQRRRSGPTS